MRATGRPRVCVFTLGGTIASLPGECGSAVVPTLGAEELVAAVPGLGEVPTVEAITFRTMPSGELGPADLLELDAAIRDRLAAGCVGAVVTQGTDTLEETAFTLDLLPGRRGAGRRHRRDAQPEPGRPRRAGQPAGGVQVATAPQCRNLGAVVVFADEIHSGRFVRKTHTSSIATFRSDLVGPLGWVSEGVPRVAMRPADRRWIDSRGLGEVPPVALLGLSPGDDGRLLGHVSDLGYRGLVIGRSAADT